MDISNFTEKIKDDAIRLALQRIQSEINRLEAELAKKEDKDAV